MKPIELQLKAFGPYEKTYTIDFSQLYAAGVFLISGETGAGRRAFGCDYVCAVWQKQRGGPRRSRLYALTVCRGGGGDICLPSFLAQGQAVPVSTRAAHGPAVETGGERLEYTYIAGEFFDGLVHPFSANIKKTSMERYAQEIIGLTYEQFCQVVIRGRVV